MNKPHRNRAQQRARTAVVSRRLAQARSMALFALTALLLACWHGIAAADSYPEPVYAGARGLPAGGVAATGSQAQFEDVLREQFPGTYLLYGKLDAPHRKQVYTEYRETGEFLSVRQKIIALNAR